MAEGWTVLTRAVSGLGDSALLGPASLCLLLYLVLAHPARLAAAWATALAVGLAATVAAKLAFHACGRAITDYDVVSPSGHASFALIFYGALATVLGAGRSGPARAALATGATLVVLAVGGSRVRLGVHTAEEVLLGFLAGAIGLVTFQLLHARAGRPGVSPLPLAIGFAGAFLILGGQHFSLEGPIGAFAKRLAANLDVCAEPEPPG